MLGRDCRRVDYDLDIQGCRRLGGKALRYTVYSGVSTFPFSICVGSPVVLSPSALLTASLELRNCCNFWSFFLQCGFFLSLL